MIQFTEQELRVSGKIDYSNAEQFYAAGLKEIQRQQQFPLTVNLSELEHGSTLALAVLVRWLRQTPNAQGLQFKAVPEKMMKIIQSCHLEHDLKII
ncbi:STAS domain-containing protein [Acinetobacter tianfuensis]|uniref:Anti-sigma factor antagonist n=1 Tax=Acinetobacter tianfuensis TaxID=2419603 RepID=A0A3A8EFL1_9GAMM|nr:STAS domain-containing protein [Acinetobacter tianfuensis]RKG32306.1 anti-sigma factor antagonist [Acinetobacter tianfuensis]